MAICFKCRKPVYFAERTRASGKEWHKRCFTCTQCGKILHPGKHSEHKGLPYCDIPCYCALFGPHVYHRGVGGFEFSPTSPTARRSSVPTMAKTAAESTAVFELDLDAKLKAYNDYFAAISVQQITLKKLDDSSVLEGQLRVHWGIRSPIYFKQKDETPSPSPAKHRHSCSVPVTDNHDVQTDALKCNGTSESTIDSTDPFDSEINDDGVVLRKRFKRRSANRLSVINGHCYNRETSVFVPWHGSVTVVTVTSLDDSSRTIRLLLDKFKVENSSDEYCLSVVRSSGETRALGDSDIPLLERIILGPLEDDAKIFIIEQQQTFDITEEVAQYINLPEAVLRGFLDKCYRDEERDVQWIQEKFGLRKQALEERMLELCRC